MDITFLGTGAGGLTPHRGAAGIVFRAFGTGKAVNDAACWLFDCGESTQLQLMKCKDISKGKINKIFITHLHGDHLYGLPGMLHEATANTDFKKGKYLEIYGPEGSRDYIRYTLLVSGSRLGEEFRYQVNELVPSKNQVRGATKRCPKINWFGNNLHLNEVAGKQILPDDNDVWHLFEEPRFTVKASWLHHKIASWGYVIEENVLERKLNFQKLLDEKVPQGPLYGRLKKGERVSLEDGRVLDPEDYLFPARKGNKVVILGDTMDSSAMKSIAKDCDVLVHESTLENSMMEDCLDKGHSTAGMAGSFAKDIGAKTLVLTHFSHRYKDPDQETRKPNDPTTSLLQQEAKEAFGPDNVILAKDFLTVGFNSNLMTWEAQPEKT